MEKKGIETAICDHSGKTSSARVAAIAGTLTGCAIAAAPLWGGPAPDMNIVIAVMGGPSALALWQKISAEPKLGHNHEGN